MSSTDAASGASSHADARSRAFTQDSVTAGYERHLLTPLFEPWAADMVERARLRPGDAVLDVASGLGPVARRAASAVGRAGRVVALDISRAMLERARSLSPPTGAGAEVEAGAASGAVHRLVCSAETIACRAAAFDAVLCQQGLQFFPDRAAAAREMRRVVRAGGTGVVSVWSAERPWGLLGHIVEVMAASGLPEPYPGAFDPQTRRLSRGILAGLLRETGWKDVSVETVELDAVWPSVTEAVATIHGTPFAPLFEALPADKQRRIEEDLAGRLPPEDGGSVRVRSAASVAHAVG
jgi:SAM-dependent methyltransferase